MNFALQVLMSLIVIVSLLSLIYGLAVLHFVFFRMHLKKMFRMDLALQYGDEDKRRISKSIKFIIIGGVSSAISMFCLNWLKNSI